MIDVLWHGRGGQGAFTAARLLGDAVSADGTYTALAFPSFGPERRGAPVRAFTKFDTNPIGDRSAIAQADFVVYLDETLVGDRWADELKPGGLALVNSAHTFDDPRLRTIDADRISREIMGRPQANTALLGALATLCAPIQLNHLIDALHRSLPERHWQGNEATLEEAARVMADDLATHPIDKALSPLHSPTSPDTEPSTAQPQKTRGIQPFVIQPAPASPAEYASTTCYAAPLIVKDNAGWRSSRPVVDPARCTGCRECYNYCPDGALYMGDRPAGMAPNEKAATRPIPHLDELFCKGCGICARVCPTDALTMVPEQAVEPDPAEGGRR